MIIGVDPHKVSATIEGVDGHEKLRGSGRFKTDQAGYTAMRTHAKAWPDRVSAVEGGNGAGRPPLPMQLDDLVFELLLGCSHRDTSPWPS